MAPRARPKSPEQRRSELLVVLTSSLQQRFRATFGLMSRPAHR